MKFLILIVALIYLSQCLAEKVDEEKKEPQFKDPFHKHNLAVENTGRHERRNAKLTIENALFSKGDTQDKYSTPEEMTLKQLYARHMENFLKE
ncbi:hypothetical protein K501DRAFT_286586 [Backusella circina FSU 941]|nr:hypothetical protein K501DRAFT_286586 [Backusella circina FSU 941]